MDKLQKTTPQTPQPTKPSALAVMASRVSVEPGKLLDTLRATCFKGASNEELLALVVVANEYQLNPLLKELYAFPAKGGGIVPVVGVDGWTKIVNRQPDYDGIKFTFDLMEDGTPVCCTATLRVKGRSEPVEVTEYYDECKRDTEPWRKMPKRMLRHRAFIQAARLAFGFSGIIDDDEAADLGRALDVREPASVQIYSSAPKPVAAPEPETDTVASESEPERPDEPGEGPQLSEAQRQLSALLDSDEFRKTNGTFNDVLDFATNSLKADVSAVTSIMELPDELCRQLVAKKTGMRVWLRGNAERRAKGQT